MFNPYRMIEVNVLALTVVIVGLLFYKYVYPKKNINLLCLVMLFSLLPLISILRKGTYESGDLSLQTYASFSFYHSLFDGQLVPRWAGDVIFGYGAPYHLIMYLLPYYVISFFHFIGFSMLQSVKFLLAISYIASGFTMYVWVKEEKNQLAGCIAAIFYLFAPYHLVDMHFRVEPGEMLCFVFIPLTFYFTKKLLTKTSYILFLSLAISVASIILSHQAIALFILPFLAVYIILFSKKNKKLILFSAVITGCLLTSFYTIPLLLEGGKYTIVGNFLSNKLAFQQISEYFYSPWRYGLLFQGPSGQLSFILGYTHWVFLVFSLYYVWKKKFKQKKLVIFILLSFALMFFLLQQISQPIWEIFRIAKFSQNTYRFLILLSFFSSASIGIVLSNIKSKKNILLICFITIAVTILNWGNRRTIPVISTDDFFSSQVPYYITQNNGKAYATPIWVNTEKVNLHVFPKFHIEALNGKIQYKEISRTSIKHEYVINVQNNSIVKENTLYFPGWNVFVDNKPTKINYNNSKYPGIITFSLAKGLHKVVLTFSDTPVRKFADIISISLLLILLLYPLLYRRFPKTKI